MPRFSVTITNAEVGNLNLSVQVEAANILEALDKAKEEAQATIKATGLVS